MVAEVDRGLQLVVYAALINEDEVEDLPSSHRSRSAELDDGEGLEDGEELDEGQSVCGSAPVELDGEGAFEGCFDGSFPQTGGTEAGCVTVAGCVTGGIVWLIV